MTIGSRGNRRAFLVSTTAPTLPVVIDATHNAIKWDTVNYLILAYCSALSSTSDISFPVTIDASHNQFEYNEQEYIIPSGVYKTRRKLAKAVANAVQVGDASLLSTHVTVEPGVATGSAITRKASVGRLHFVVWGATDVSAFGTGASNDCLGRLGLADADTLAVVGYPDLDTLAHAINAALDSATGLVRLDTLIKTSVSDEKLPGTPTEQLAQKLRHERLLAGVSTKVFATGASNSALIRIGLANNDAVANGA